MLWRLGKNSEFARVPGHVNDDEEEEEKEKRARM